MKSATMTERNLQIDGMSGDTCVKKVTGALKGVQDVSTRSVEVGSATIEADQTGCDAACSAIGKAGFKARESEGSERSDEAGFGAEGARNQQPQAGQRGQESGGPNSKPAAKAQQGLSGGKQAFGSDRQQAPAHPGAGRLDEKNEAQQGAMPNKSGGSKR